MVIGRIKFLVSTVLPKPEEIDYWIDILADPYGSVIRTWNGFEWKRIDLFAVDAIEGFLNTIEIVQLTLKLHLNEIALILEDTNNIHIDLDTHTNLITVQREDFELHKADNNNPHSVTKELVGLGNADNTADTDKPISTATLAALNTILGYIDVVSDELTAHKNDKENPHKVTKAQVGLGNCDNTSDLNKPVSTATQAAIDSVSNDLLNHELDINNPHSVTKSQVGLGNLTNDIQVKRNEMGVANGVATLNEQGLIPTSQLPSYVDDVIDCYATYTKAEDGTLSNIKLYSDELHQQAITGESGKIYVDITDSATSSAYQFRWTGTWFAVVGAPTVIGEVTGTAFDGKRGKSLEDKTNTHISNTSNPHNVTKALVGLGNVDNTSDINKPISTATLDALDNKLNILVSGTNIKTVNGLSLLGEGDILIQSGGVGKVDSTSGTGEIFNHYDRNVATGVYSHAEGYMTTASGNRSHAEGSDTIASGFKSHAEGQHTTAGGETSHAEGYNTKAEYTGSHSEGYYTIANGRGAHAEGYYTIAKGIAAHAEGQYTITLDNGHSEGRNTLSLGSYSHAEGYGNTLEIICKVTEATDDYIIINRKILTISSNNYFLIYPNIVNIYSITKVEYPTDNTNTTKITYKITSGSGNKIEVNNYDRTFIFYRQGVAIGDYSHSEGYYTKALGDGSHSEGFGTEASGSNSHAEGGSTRASGNNSHAEGLDTYANGDYSHSEGIETNAIGLTSHAEGKGSIAYGDQSHAAGFQSIAAGNYTVALGGSGLALAVDELETYLNSPTPASDLLEAYSTKYYSSEDSYHIAYGKGAMVTGKNNLALGNYSSAHGEGNVAYKDHQFIVGKFGQYKENIAFAVGWGTYYGNRLNAFEVLNDGNANLKGTLNQSSDIRLKENVKDLENKGSLHLVEFDWKNGNGHSYGFIADEVEKIYPDMVSEDSSGYKVLNYNAAICAKLAELESIIKQQLELINKLEKQILL